MICGMKIFFSCGILVTYERRYGWCCCCCWSCCPWSCGLRSGCWGRAVQRRPVRTARLTISTDNFFSSTVSLLSNVRSPSMTSSLGCVEVNLFSSHRVFTGFVWISKGTLLVFIYWYFIFFNGLHWVRTAAGQQVWPGGVAPRFLAGAWCLCALIVANLYVGMLVSFMSTPRPDPVIKSIDDLATVNIDWGVRRGASTVSYFTVGSLSISLV